MMVEAALMPAKLGLAREPASPSWLVTKGLIMRRTDSLKEIASFPKIVHEHLGCIKDVPEARRIAQPYKHRN
jgi:hypothetical protein